MQQHGLHSSRLATPVASTPISGPTRCVTASPRTCSSEAWTSGSSRSCSGIRASLHGDRHPPDRALAGPAPHAAEPDDQRPLRGKEAPPWLIPAFARPRWTSSWRTPPPLRSPIHFPIRPPDDALAQESTFGHRRLLHSRAGGTALPLRRLPRHVLALPLLPEPGVPQMPCKPDPAMAPRASSRTAAVRLFSCRRNRAVGVARCSNVTRSCCTVC